LYLCEAACHTPLAALIAIVAVMVQCRRMINEEAILKVAFPEYRANAANTSFLIPTRLSRFFCRIEPAVGG
jgi:hypothetical protein